MVYVTNHSAKCCNLSIVVVYHGSMYCLVLRTVALNAAIPASTQTNAQKLALSGSSSSASVTRYPGIRVAGSLLYLSTPRST